MTNKIMNLIDELSRKAGISELIINNLDTLFVEREGELLRIDYKISEEDLEHFCQDMASYNRKEFDSTHPILDGNLPDGSRVNFIHKDYTRASHAVTIRRFSKAIRTFDTSPNVFGLSKKAIDFLKILVKSRFNIMVSGGTGVGKTTFLNLMLQEIPTNERVITIEDTRELNFKLSNVVRLEARPASSNMVGLTIRDLLKNTLRMRPDRIIVGEVRGGEVFDLLQAMNTGHEGSMASIHSNSPGECLMRLENLYLLSGYDLPIKALRHQVSTAIDFVLQIKRDKKGARIISQFAEVCGMEGDRILMQDIMVHKEGELQFTGLVPSCMEDLVQGGLPRNFFIDT
jgi:pilus assembly protein CpaF